MREWLLICVLVATATGCELDGYRSGYDDGHSAGFTEGFAAGKKHWETDEIRLDREIADVEAFHTDKDRKEFLESLPGLIRDMSYDNLSDFERARKIGEALQYCRDNDADFVDRTASGRLILE